MQKIVVIFCVATNMSARWGRTLRLFCQLSTRPREAKYQKVTLQAAFTPAYHDFAVIRRYTAPHGGLPRHCDNGDAPEDYFCNEYFSDCILHLRENHCAPSHITGLTPLSFSHLQQVYLTGRGGNHIIAEKCHHMPAHCFVFACGRRSRSGCASIAELSWPGEIPARLPKRHVLFRS